MIGQPSKTKKVLRRGSHPTAAEALQQASEGPNELLVPFDKLELDVRSGLLKHALRFVEGRCDDTLQLKLACEVLKKRMLTFDTHRVLTRLVQQQNSRMVSLHSWF